MNNHIQGYTPPENPKIGGTPVGIEGTFIAVDPSRIGDTSDQEKFRDSLMEIVVEGLGDDFDGVINVRSTVPRVRESISGNTGFLQILVQKIYMM